MIHSIVDTLTTRDEAGHVIEVRSLVVRYHFWETASEARLTLSTATIDGTTLAGNIADPKLELATAWLSKNVDRCVAHAVKEQGRDRTPQFDAAVRAMAGEG